MNSNKSLKGEIMAANAMVQTRILESVKQDAATALAAMGLTISDAVRMLLTKIAHERTLPFSPLVPNATTIAAMQEAKASKLPKARSLAQLKAALHEDD